MGMSRGPTNHQNWRTKRVPDRHYFVSDGKTSCRVFPRINSRMGKLNLGDFDSILLLAARPGCSMSSWAVHRVVTNHDPWYLSVGRKSCRVFPRIDLRMGKLRAVTMELDVGPFFVGFSRVCWCQTSYDSPSVWFFQVSPPLLYVSVE